MRYRIWNRLSWSILPILFVSCSLDQQESTERAKMSVRQITALQTEEASAVSDWPNLFGPTFDCVVPGPPILTHWSGEGPPELWRREIGTGYSSPIVVRGKVVLLHRVGEFEVILCCNADSGATVWEYRYPTSFQCEVNYTSGPYSTPVSDGKFVFAIGAEGKMHCLELATGEVVWKRNLHEEFDAPIRLYGMGHSPLLWQDRLYINVGGQASVREYDKTGIVCVRKQSGDILWSSTEDGASYATPRIARIHDRDWLFVLTHQHGMALDPENGRVFWRIPLGINIVDAENAVSPLVYRDTVTFSSYGNGTVCSRVMPDAARDELWFSRR